MCEDEIFEDDDKSAFSKTTSEWASDSDFQKTYNFLSTKFPNLDEKTVMYSMCRAQGDSRRVAYEKSYGIEGLTEEQIVAKVSNIGQSARVTAVMNYLKANCLKQAENKLSWHFEDSLRALKFLVDEAMDEINEAKSEGKKQRLTLTRVSAIKDAVKEINSMYGYTSNVTNIANTVTIIGNEADLQG